MVRPAAGSAWPDDAEGWGAFDVRGFSHSAKERRALRFVIILLVLAIAAMAGLYIYGQMLEPEQQMIEEEARDAAS